MFRFLTAGESHGPGLTVIVEGLPAGVSLTEEYIAVQLARRQRGYGRGGRMKIESDFAHIRGGVRLGETLGSPIAMWIENRDFANWTEAMAVGPPDLGVEAVYSSPIPTGSGVVRTLHGQTPVPAPATLALLTDAGAPIVPPPGGIQDAGEMVTPTGAALLTTLATFEQPEMTIERSGYGLGSRDPAAYPNALGLWIGPETEARTSLVLLETNIDDESPQVLAYVVERLLALGAKDAWLSQAQMKKGRAGQVLSALVAPVLEQRAADLIMRETTTLGVRSNRVHRREAAREQVIVQTEFGPMPVKFKKLGVRVADATPEYETAKRIALEKRVPLRDVLAAARKAVRDLIDRPSD